ncbi:quinoprotein dehydrogenase-associated putative ABC transporter substrate-binding protein [Benzoatithermus flavus]|uniref:Quinoprotein dehydrogenase-associated putative ABC transporter substrate-binding protein n=1 Tax=Benzoatithermus flavus TaxID=3108223 RepID=A0ABU8XPG4_9PROT
MSFSHPISRVAIGAIALAAALLRAPFPAVAQTQAPLGELVDRTALRVCADPNDLPFSNDKGEGFENKIAELMAQRLGVPLQYTWFPQSVGFVRNTLRANRCDLIMGVVAADELVQNTNPYYRSAYVLVHRADEGDRFGSLDSPLMQTARIGIVAGTPVADLLVRKNLMAQARPYQLLVDTRLEQPARQMIEDLAKGDLDVALLWGPIAGYWIRKQATPLTLVPLTSDPRTGLRLDFRISMGIRPNEPLWKHDVNTLIRELKPEIQKILLDYGVPLLDEQGRLITAGAGEGAASPVAEPAGYRMDNYRAPVPATLEGATVLTTQTLRTLIEERHPVLVDVLPKARKPRDRAADQLWIEPERDDIPGSVWLPNVGYGELSAEFALYFRTELERLTGGDKTKPIVFYCDAHCWMSWNAAKRAVTELGYTQVYWYPEGVDGWKKAGLEVARAQEVPMPDFVQ